MVKRSFIFGLLISTFLCAQIAMGEELQPSWSFTPSIGFSLFEGGSLKDRPVFNLGAGLKLDERWEVEGSVGYINTETKGKKESELEIYQAVMGLRYDLGSSKALIPYLLAGGGGFYADSDMFGTASGISLHLGAGLRYRLNEAVALKGEVRQQTFFGMLDDEGKRKNSSDLTTLVGLEFRFPEDRRVTVSSVSEAAVKDLGAVMEAPIVALSATQVAPKPLKPVVVVNPRFNTGEEKILGWSPTDLEKISTLIKDQPMANILVMSDFNEKDLSFPKFKLQERRALYLRFFLIGHFGLDPNSVKIISHQNLIRYSKEELDRRILIRFVPVESDPELPKVSTTPGRMFSGRAR